MDKVRFLLVKSNQPGLFIPERILTNFYILPHLLTCPFLPPLMKLRLKLGSQCCRDNKRRSVWFFAHWMLGTTVSLLGIINVYTGLHAYQNRTSKSITPWVIFYTSEIVCIGVLYLFLEKWEYILKQGVTQGNEPTTTIQPTDNREILAKRNENSCWLKLA